MSHVCVFCRPELFCGVVCSFYRFGMIEKHLGCSLSEKNYYVATIKRGIG